MQVEVITKPTFDEKVRADMQQYWQAHDETRGATVQAMMLDDDAPSISAAEMPEMLSFLPNLEGKQVLELAAGIGRYTAELSKTAAHVHAVEFMPDFAETNRQTHANCDNVTVETNDVTQLQREDDSADVIFSCWLMMYLSDSEVKALIDNMLRWLRPGGTLILRESCFGPSNPSNNHGAENPTNYRTTHVYTRELLGARRVIGDMQHRFDLVRSRCITEYVVRRGNPGQVAWQLTKVVEPLPEGYSNFQAFLDGQQYSVDGVLKYERVFGSGFVSTGGLETTRKYTALLGLQEGQHVLDVGCGIGGGDFYMADKYGARVLGIDLSTNMVNIALERAFEKRSNKVQFEIADATTIEYEEGEFDVVYSRDTILHIEDKLSLFQRFFRFLKPGGKLLITDYCGAEEERRSDEFKAYVAQRGYHLLTPAAYGLTLEEAGFTDVIAHDATADFTKALRSELARLEEEREDFLQHYTEEDYAYLEGGWRAKLERCAAGDQMWGFFMATKPDILPDLDTSSDASL